MLRALAESIVTLRNTIPSRRAALIAVSGIDGCGKGWLAGRLARVLEEREFGVAVVNVDAWLNLPDVHFGDDDPGARFYRHALRFEEMFASLVLPLRDRRQVDVEIDLAEETARAYRRHRYRFEDIDLVLLEGIFLLKRQHRIHYDASVWIDCTFETALERAIARGQEGLPPEETVRAYETIYFPAQRLHASIDAPREAATWIVPNDRRLSLPDVTPAC